MREPKREPNYEALVQLLEKFGGAKRYPNLMAALAELQEKDLRLRREKLILVDKLTEAQRAELATVSQKARPDAAQRAGVCQKISMR